MELLELHWAACCGFGYNYITFNSTYTINNHLHIRLVNVIPMPFMTGATVVSCFSLVRHCTVGFSAGVASRSPALH